MIIECILLAKFEKKNYILSILSVQRSRVSRSSPKKNVAKKMEDAIQNHHSE